MPEPTPADEAIAAAIALAELWRVLAADAERALPGSVDPDVARGLLACHERQRRDLEQRIGGELPEHARTAHERLCAALARHVTN